MSIASLDGVTPPQSLVSRTLNQVPAWLWFGAAVFIMLAVGGNRMLQDADMYWQIAVGQSIIDHHAFPVTDSYSFTKLGVPWISSSWLAQVLYAAAYAMAGWAGPVILASLGVAAAFALLVHGLSQRFAASHAILVAMIAVLLSLHHFLARPHVLAMPVMVAWVYGLVSASDRSKAPSFWLLPLIVLWANLHGGFVLGLALVAPFALDALWNAEASQRKALALRWAAFGVCAVAASCITPYGWNSLLAARQILDLGGALALIGEWQPADFSSLGLFEICLLASLAAVLWRGIVLTPTRILLVLGFLHMALSHSRNIEVFALLVPLVLASPVSLQLRPSGVMSAASKASFAGVVAMILLVSMTTWAFVANHTYTPVAAQTPTDAVNILQARKAERILHNPGFGGYLITKGIPVFIDGRAELYGEKFVVNTLHALDLKNAGEFLGLLDSYKIDATMLRPETPAIHLLDRLEGWQRIFADDVAVVHMRKSGNDLTDPKIKPPGHSLR